MEALEETYREVALKTLPEKPYSNAAGIQTVLDEYAKRIPKAKTMKPEDFMDSSFVKNSTMKNFTTGSTNARASVVDEAFP